MTDAVKLQRLRDQQLDEYLSYNDEECELEELLDLIDLDLVQMIESEWDSIIEGDFSEELDQRLVEIQDKYFEIDCDREEIEEAIFDKICEIKKINNNNIKEREFISRMVNFILL